MSSNPSSSDPDRTRHKLRREMLARRNAMPGREARTAAEATARHLAATSVFLSAGRIAGYVALDNELDPAPLIELASAAGMEIYLPRVLDACHMEFTRWRPGDRLQENRFGIPEPVSEPAQLLAPEALDLVLVPLLGFDSRGNRLGFGAGYYDRAFAFKQAGSVRPLLCGYAYAWQKVPSLAAADWDVALDAVATERGVTQFRRDKRI